MALLLVITGIGLAGITQLACSYDQSLFSEDLSRPALTSKDGTVLQKLRSSQSEVKAVVQLIKILKWHHTIVLFDHHHSEDLQILLPVLELTSVYDLGTFHHSVGVRQFLQELHRKFFPRLHFLLLCKFSEAMELLQIVDAFDLESNRTTDFRHFSSWILTCSSDCQKYVPLLPPIHNLENVAIVTSEGGAGYIIRHLLTSKGQKFFSAGRCTDDMKNKQDIFPNTKYGLQNRTLIVATLVDEPFVVRAENGYSGYCFDILNSLATSLNFSYNLVQPADSQWGRRVNGSWNGFVAQLQRREVDLVISSFTINEDREKVMDFLYPPIFTNIDDIIYKLHDEEGNWWLYLKPFNSLVLLLLLGALMAVSLIMSVCDWYETDYIQHDARHQDKWRCCFWKMTGIFFYVFGSLLNRGVQMNPQSLFTRILLFTWGVFSVITASIYSAALVSNYAVHKERLPFTSLEELLTQKEYKWGLRAGAIREHIFKISKTGGLKLYWDGVVEFNETDPEVLSEDYSVHVSKVKNEKYAFVIDRTQFDRIKDQDCRLRSIGQDILWQQYGLGVPTDYPLKKDLEETLYAMTDSGLLDIWWQRWKKKKPNKCFHGDRVNALTLPDVASAFFALCVGLGTAGIVLMLELLKKRLNLQ